MSGRKEVRLLVIEDPTERYDELKDYAEMYNPDYRIECMLASTVAEVKKAIESWTPTVVLMDMYLDDPDAGIDLLDYVSNSSAPVIATSQSRIPEIEKTVELHGGAGYVQQADGEEELESLLDMLAEISIEVEPAH